MATISEATMSDAPPPQILNENKEGDSIQGPEDTIPTSSDAMMSDAPLPKMKNQKREGSSLEGLEEKRRKVADVMTLDQMDALDWGTTTAREMDRWMQEYFKKQRLLHPWWDEADRPLEQPPDINYRRIIFNDGDRIERLLANHEMHFEERCLRYRTYDFEVERTLLTEYVEWCEGMAEAAQEDDRRNAFLWDLRSNLEHDVAAVQREESASRHEVEMRKHIKAMQDGSQRFFHFWRRCWYYFDELRQEWLVEPQEKGLLYDERLNEWREEALSKTPQQYFDFTKCRFYNYNRGQDRWDVDGPTFNRLDGLFFKYDKNTGQWRPSEFILKFQTEQDLRRQASPQGQTDREGTQPNDANSGVNRTTNEGIPSPSSSVDTQAELDAQLASTLQEA